MKNFVLTICTLLSVVTLHGEDKEQNVSRRRHLVVLDIPGQFCGWPANNGLWSWDKGREILVGCTLGGFQREKQDTIS